MMTLMARVRLFHWKSSEAGGLLKTLRAGGHRVDYDENITTGVLRGIRTSPPDAFVVDLSRMPSHGRGIAIYLRRSPATRRIPVVFVDGDPGKVEAIRKQLPDAMYVSAARIRSALRQAIANPPEAPIVPVIPPHAPRPAAQKLGIREGSAVALIDPPRDYASVIGKVPAGVTFEEDGAAPCPVTLWFVDDPEVFLDALPRFRSLAARTKFWILWRKQAARKGSRITAPFLRECAIAVGLVDYKICAVNETWSGMAFGLRRSTRRVKA